ncbi:hypothetical protein A0H81_14951 [Grifola frondosa]|uniref:Uncharacterized protein n=1 Tax=Grifola frondosa TaxID=5627 RepID=A0A1C7LQL8_GRIFR|nr:hypothetical protein A0H81_14951 [Grifola frondosa]
MVKSSMGCAYVSNSCFIFINAYTSSCSHCETEIPKASKSGSVRCCAIGHPPGRCKAHTLGSSSWKCNKT